jgi:WD40 repeat protein
MATSAGDDRIALACRDSTVRIGAMEQTRWTVARGTTGEFHSTAYSPDGTFVLGGSAQGDVYIWNSAGGERVHRLSGLNAQVVLVYMNENQTHVLGIAEDGDGMVWEIPRGTSDESAARGRRFDACEGIVVATSLSLSKQWLAVASADSLRIWNLKTLAETGMATQLGETARTTQRIYSIAIDNDAKKIAIGSDGGEVHVREVQTLVGKAKD